MELYHIYMCVLFLVPVPIKGHDPDAGPKKRGHLPRICHPIASDWEGPGRDRLWVGSRLNWRSMVDTSVLDARKHGLAFAHSITTELPSGGRPVQTFSKVCMSLQSLRLANFLQTFCRLFLRIIYCNADFLQTFSAYHLL